MTQTYNPPTRAFTLPDVEVLPNVETAPSWGPLRRLRFGLLSGWSLLWFMIFNLHGGYSWHYFVQGSTLLFEGAAPGHPQGGLHVYANYPQLQIGPLTFAVAEVLRQVGPLGGRLFAELVMTALGLVVLYLVEHIALTLRPELRWGDRFHYTMLAGGAAFVIGWTI